MTNNQNHEIVEMGTAEYEVQMEVTNNGLLDTKSSHEVQELSKRDVEYECRCADTFESEDEAIAHIEKTRRVSEHQSSVG